MIWPGAHTTTCLKKSNEAFTEPDDRITEKRMTVSHYI